MKQGYGRDRTNYFQNSDGFAFQPMTNQKFDNRANTNKVINLCTINNTPADKGLNKYSVEKNKNPGEMIEYNLNSVTFKSILNHLYICLFS